MLHTQIDLIIFSIITNHVSLCGFQVSMNSQVMIKIDLVKKVEYIWKAIIKLAGMFKGDSTTEQESLELWN